MANTNISINDGGSRIISGGMNKIQRNATIQGAPSGVIKTNLFTPVDKQTLKPAVMPKDGVIKINPGIVKRPTVEPIKGTIDTGLKPAVMPRNGAIKIDDGKIRIDDGPVKKVIKPVKGTIGTELKPAVMPKDDTIRIDDGPVKRVINPVDGTIGDKIKKPIQRDGTITIDDGPVKRVVKPVTGCGSVLKPAVMPKEGSLKGAAYTIAGGAVAGGSIASKKLVANIPALREQANKAKQISNDLISGLKKSQQTLDSLGDKWKGADANKYIEATREKLKNLEVISKVMDLYQKASEDAIKKVEDTQSTVTNIINNMNN